MKQNILYILSGIFLLASCQQEELPGEESRYGYLSLKSVVAEVENVNAPASRALPAVNSKDLYVEVWEGEKKVLSYAPGETIPERIKLPEGIYTAKAYNEAYTTFKSLEDGALGDPVFYGESDEFSVAESEVPAEQTVLKLFRIISTRMLLKLKFHAMTERSRWIIRFLRVRTMCISIWKATQKRSMF